jgi:hypothetical protein
MAEGSSRLIGDNPMRYQKINEGFEVLGFAGIQPGELLQGILIDEGRLQGVTRARASRRRSCSDFSTP